jgi:hypothetical protein
LEPRDFVTAILVYFLSTDLIRIVAYALSGYLTPATVHLYSRMAPAALAGYGGGIAVRRMMVSPETFRVVVLLLLTAYGLALLIRAFVE